MIVQPKTICTRTGRIHLPSAASSLRMELGGLLDDDGLPVDILAGMNILPIPGLDGGHALFTFLGKW